MKKRRKPKEKATGKRIGESERTLIGQGERSGGEVARKWKEGSEKIVIGYGERSGRELAR